VQSEFALDIGIPKFFHFLGKVPFVRSQYGAVEGCRGNRRRHGRGRPCGTDANNANENETEQISSLDSVKLSRE
jgi:hypothetical protein